MTVCKLHNVELEEEESPATNNYDEASGESLWFDNFISYCPICSEILRKADFENQFYQLSNAECEYIIYCDSNSMENTMLSSDYFVPVSEWRGDVGVRDAGGYD